MQACAPAEISTVSGYCAKWLTGGDARLRRAAVQAYGFIAELGAPHFGRRIRPHLPRLTEVLQAHAVEVNQL